ncbi:MAG TPA: type II CAAX endopeptidase family protein [Tepidisphaeraceae bacterium]|nr:type II CAAX endopeptidase family protein [Tepidisphaeraceae bacterium]
MILAELLRHIAAALPATAPSTDNEAFPWLIFLAASAPGLILALAGAWRPRKVLGPDRVGPFHSGLQLLAVLLFGFFSYMLVISAYSTRVHPHKGITDTDLAFLASVPPTIAFVLILTGDVAIGGRVGMKSLGLDPGQIPRGILFGIIGALIAVPLVEWSMQLTEVLYLHWHYAHPMEHELLPAMREGPVWARAAVFFGALVAAPLFEETIFRGHLQTLLRSLFIRLSGSAGTRPWHSWLAIFLASLAFAAMHPVWMMPPIFVLALCLGYAYERTGLLWTTITMHALFNGIETFLYFHFR